jgi:hypothetical protein
MKAQDCETVPGNPGAFRKGHDSRRQPGGIDAKTRNTRRKLAKLDGKALALLERLLDEGDPEGLKVWAKYRLPVPTEKTAVDMTVKTEELRPALAAKLAALNEAH